MVPAISAKPLELVQRVRRVAPAPPHAHISRGDTSLCTTQEQKNRFLLLFCITPKPRVE